MRILVTPPSTARKGQTHEPVTSVCAYGDVQLPIYVRSASLCFRYCETRDAIVMLGRAKSYGISVSDGDLRHVTSVGNHAQSLSPKHKRKAQLQTIWSTDTTTDTGTTSHCLDDNRDVTAHRVDLSVAVTRASNARKLTLKRQAKFRERSFTK